MPDAPPAVFLARDGVLMEPTQDPAMRWEHLKWAPEVFPALRRIYETGARTVIVHHEPAVGQGLAELAEVQGLLQRVRRELAARKLHLDAAYQCPHGPASQCRCRPPAPGLFLQAAADLELDLDRCVLVTTRSEDVEAAEEAGVGLVLQVAFGGLPGVVEQIREHLETPPAP